MRLGFSALLVVSIQANDPLQRIIDVYESNKVFQSRMFAEEGVVTDMSRPTGSVYEFVALLKHSQLHANQIAGWTGMMAEESRSKVALIMELENHTETYNALEDLRYHVDAHRFVHYRLGPLQAHIERLNMIVANRWYPLTERNFFEGEVREYMDVLFPLVQADVVSERESSHIYTALHQLIFTSLRVTLGNHKSVVRVLLRVQRDLVGLWLAKVESEVARIDQTILYIVEATNALGDWPEDAPIVWKPEPEEPSQSK